MREGKKVKKSKAGRYANRDGEADLQPVLPGNMTLDIVYDALQEMIFTKDAKGRITSVNDVFARHCNTTKEDLIGKTAFTMGTMPEGEAARITRNDEEVMQSKSPLVFRRWVEFADGVKMFAEEVTTPLFVDGEAAGVLVTIRDLTELKLMMDEVERQNAILGTIGRVTELMLEPDINVFKKSIYEAMEIIAKGINADRIDIWHLHKEGREVRYELEYGWSSENIAGNLVDADIKDAVLPIDSKAMVVFEKGLTKGKIINSKVSDMAEEAREIYRKYGVETARSVLIMPINLDDGYWGFIAAFDMENERVFTENEELLLRSSRRMIASAMTRVEITKSLMQKTDQLQYEVNSKRDFLARMSHEIRTPMNAILGMTELALRERMSNVANEHIMTVKQTGMNLLSIINDILDFSKIESGNMEIINADYSLSSLIYDIISIIRMKLAYTRIRFIVDIDSNLPCGLIGDEGKMRQILINLLSNAVKYTQKGFIKLTIKGEIESDVLQLTMVVTDSGKGIKEEDQAKLFHDYIQVDQEKNVGIEGVGLGLSITHGLVTAMDGVISLTSVYGEGSEFTVTIPQKIEDFERLAKVNEPEKATTLVYERRSLYVNTLVGAIENLGVKCSVVDRAEDALKEMATGSYAYIIGSNELLVELKYDLEMLGNEFEIIGIAEFGDESDSVWRTLSTPIHTISLVNVYNGEADRYMYTDEEEAAGKFSAPEARVLVVDDIVTNLKVASGLLSVFDVEIDVCGSGQEALDLVRENRYDIIFMDHRMPGMDGVETTRHIREMGRVPGGGTLEPDYFKSVPIVVLTANVMSDMKDMFSEAGFNDFVAKPIDTVVLSGVMRKWIPKSKQRRYYSVGTVEDKAALGFDTGISLKIPGVDVNKGFRASSGRMEIYLEILATFMDEASERITQLHEFIQEGNTRMYTISVHALKGALANIGADDLSVIAAKLEVAGDNKDMDYIEKNNERFVSGIKRLIVNINNVLSETAKDAGSGKEPGGKETEEFISTLRVLKTAITDMNAGTMNRAVETLLSGALTEQSLSTVRLISKHILMAEYDDAAKIIDDLVSALTDSK